MKNVLLPTDLTVQSLRPIHEIVENANGERVTVTIVHILCPPSSITDLLFIGRNKPFHNVPGNFNEAIQLLRNKYVGELSIVFDFVYCNTSRYFRNFVEANKISEAYMLNNYKYKRPMSQSEDPAVYMNRCNIPLHKVELNEEAAPAYFNLSSLLNGVEQSKSKSNRFENSAVSYS